MASISTSTCLKYISIDGAKYPGSSSLPVRMLTVDEVREQHVRDLGRMSSEGRKVDAFMREMHPGQVFNKSRIIKRSVLAGTACGLMVGGSAGVVTTLVVSAPTCEVIAPIVAIPVIISCSLTGAGIGAVIGLGMGIHKVKQLGKEFSTWKSNKSQEAIARFRVYFVNEETLSICRELEPCFDDSIGMNPLQFPVIDECPVPHTFEYSEIERVLARDPRCPLTRRPTTTANLHTDYVRIGKIYAAYQITLGKLSETVQLNPDLAEGIHALRIDMREKCSSIFSAERERLDKLQADGTITQLFAAEKLLEIAKVLNPVIPARPTSTSSSSMSLTTSSTAHRA